MGSGFISFCGKGEAEIGLRYKKPFLSHLRIEALIASRGCLPGRPQSRRPRRTRGTHYGESINDPASHVLTVDFGGGEGLTHPTWSWAAGPFLREGGRGIPESALVLRLASSTVKMGYCPTEQHATVLPRMIEASQNKSVSPTMKRSDGVY